MRYALAVAGCALAVGCGGGGSPATAPPPPTTSSPAASPVAAWRLTYVSPTAMLAKVHRAGFDCDQQDPPGYNAWGAWHVACFHGAEQETVYLDVFPTAASRAQAANTGMTATYFADSWGVEAQNPATIARLRAILGR